MTTEIFGIVFYLFSPQHSQETFLIIASDQNTLAIIS